MELIIVIAVIAILAAIAIPAYIHVVDRANEAACTSNRRNIEIMFSVDAVMESDLDLQEYIDNVPAQFHCQTEGIYTADENGHVICSEHSKDASVTTPPTKEELMFGNRSDYDGAEEYLEGSSHVNGDYVIGSDGLIYECVYARVQSVDPTTNCWEWRVVGHRDGIAVEADGVTDHTYKPGTTVVKDGEYYMYTPLNSGDFNYTYSNAAYREPVDNDDWTKLEKGSTSQYVKPDKDTVMYQNNSKYNKGDVVWQNGRLYKANTDIPNSWIYTPANGAYGWDLVEN